VFAGEGKNQVSADGKTALCMLSKAAFGGIVGRWPQSHKKTLFPSWSGFVPAIHVFLYLGA
jgi:hypothetical protein